jgi:tetratricopeptide (TPR) repeat protein
MRSIGGVLIALVGILPLAPGPGRGDEASDVFRAGVRLLKENKPRDAVKALQKVARLNPTYPEVFIYLGDAWLQLKDYEEAAASFRQCWRSTAPVRRPCAPSTASAALPSD